LFEEMGIPLDVSGSTGAQVVAPQSLLFLLLDAVFSKWRRQETLAFLSHPAMRVALERMGTSYDEVRPLTYTKRLVSLDKWKEFIDDEHFGKVAGMLVELDEVLAKKPAGVEETLKKIGETVDVEGILRSLDSRRHQYFLAQWHQLTDTARMLDSGYGGETELDGKLSISALLHAFRPSDFGAKPYSAGVRVLPVEEGRANFGEVTFFVGFNGENFPPRTHKNAVLEEEYDDFLPFVSWREEIAKVSLLVGMMTARRSYLTVPLMDEENLFVPQAIDEIFRFTEAEEITDGEKIFKLLDKYVLSSRDTFKISKGTVEYGVYSIPEVVENLVKDEISVSDIEDYAQCPVKFYLSRMLGALAPEELEETISGLELGGEIHSAFERFFKEKYARAGISLPKLDTYSTKNFDAIKDFLKYLMDNFTDIYKKIKVTNDDIELLREIFGEEVSHLKWDTKNLPYTLTDIFEIEKYLLSNLHYIPELERGITENQIGTSNLPALFETKILCEIDGTLIRGKIDRIDLLPSGEVIIIDYKLGDITYKIKSKWKKEIQLKTYATMLYKAGILVNGIIYYHNLRSVNRTIISYKPITEDEITEFEKNLNAIISNLREGVIKRDLKWGNIEPSKNCRRCDLAEICPYNTR
ncbi:PD-(D/E)XK nuclease family protein, partial [bacterium]|nr:PD-(D/E)XK nuclease family protein [bacterium]